MKSKRKCRKCNHPVESSRPGWAKYCIACGRRRSRDWKRENPERAKLHGSEQAISNRRDQTAWNAYIRTWRKQHYAQYRAQNKRHVREHRTRNKRTRAASLSTRTILIGSSLLFLVLAAQGCESVPRLRVTVDSLEHFDSLLVRLTAAFTLTVACLRLISHDLARLYSEVRGRQTKSEADPPVTAIIEQDDDWFLAYCPEIPAPMDKAARTIEECRKNLAAAIELILEDRRTS